MATTKTKKPATQAGKAIKALGKNNDWDAFHVMVMKYNELEEQDYTKQETYITMKDGSKIVWGVDVVKEVKNFKK